MIVDDMESNRILLKIILENDFTIVECDSGPKCIEMVENNAPDMILLDVNMPEMTGYEVCTTLRKNAETATLPIIFVSAMDNVEERLAGFEAGGNEYITKPIDPKLLVEKINSNFAHLGEVKEAKDSADYAMKVAMEAMTSSSELGQIIEFVKSSQNVTTLEGIGEKFCEIAQGFGLNASALIYGLPHHYINCSADSMEARVLTKFQNSKESIVSIGVRTMVRSNSMALLINDMPVDDDTRYGRFKDHLMVLSSICDGRLLTIKANLSVTDERVGVLGRIIKMTEKQLKKVTHKIAEHDSTTRAVMLDMITELEAKLFTLGLDEDQEEQLMSLAYNASEKLDKLKGGVDELEDELGSVLEGLYEVLNKSK
ncbi:MAG: CheY-like chemotaxis protein [Oleiphilaceae bacterium]|jgi:CheY-like chemotaxis protein